MILIADQTSWTLFDPRTLKQKKSGSSNKIPTLGVSSLGVVVDRIESGENIKKITDEIKDPHLKMFHKFKKIPVWLISDSAFFASLPTTASLLLVDEELKRSPTLGLTHSYLAEQAAQSMGRSLLDLNVISAFLGERSSVAAIRNSAPVEVSEGLPGSFSSGNIDLRYIFQLIQERGLVKAQMQLESSSGLLGYSKVGKSIQDVLAKKKLQDNPKFKMALKIYLHQLTMLLGSYSALLGRVDVIVFSGILGLSSVILKDQLVNSVPELRKANLLNIEANPHLQAAQALFPHL